MIMKASSNSALPLRSSQLTGSPPAIYQAPKINMGDIQTLHRVVSSEFTKVARAQSYILSLWQKQSPESLQQQVSKLEGVCEEHQVIIKQLTERLNRLEG